LTSIDKWGDCCVKLMQMESEAQTLGSVSIKFSVKFRKMAEASCETEGGHYTTLMLKGEPGSGKLLNLRFSL